MEYLRVCKDLKDKGTLVPSSGWDFTNIYKSINKEKDNYASIYYFSEAHNEVFKKTGSIAGVTDVTTDRLVWDFDSEDNISVAQKDANELVKRLKLEGYSDNNIRIFFSGNKGFDVSVRLKEERLTPREVKNICVNLAEGLKTIDVKIYNATRILRLPLTKHPKSGLYKIPLSVEDLSTLTSDEIRESAKENLEYINIKDAWGTGVLSKNILQLKAKTPTIDVVETSSIPFDISDVDWSKKPRDLTHEKYLLSLGFFTQGNRSEGLIILAATLKNIGWNETQTYYACKAAADLQAQRTGEEKFPKDEIYKNIIKQVYGPSWKNGSFSVKDNSLLQQLSLTIPSEVRMTSAEDNIVSISESFATFSNYAKDIDKNTIKFGIPALDEKLVMQTGRLYGILAPPGVGKTTFGIDVVFNTSANNEPSMFASYDMACPDVIQKLIQKHTRLKPKEIYDAFKNNNIEQMEKFRIILQNNYKHVTFIFKTGQTIDDLKKSILERERQLGAPIRLLVVDYLELIQSKFSDPTQASMESIQGLREIAVGMNKAVIVMLQPSKSGTSIDEPNMSYTSAKGSSSIAQAVTAMLTLHRPGYSSRTPEKDRYMGIDCVKNRSGGLFSLDLHFDGATGNLRALEPIEAQDLYELRESKKQQKGKDDLF